MIKEKLQVAAGNTGIFIKWLFLSAVTGVGVGAAGALFAYCMNLATAFRTEHERIILFLPFAGLLIAGLYHLCKNQDDKGTNLVLSTIHAEAELPFRMAPLIFISTVLTHLFGGSAGREGAALQLGGSLGNQLGRMFRLEEEDKRVMVMCGMSAAFAALFGTPAAAAVFAIEVASVGAMDYMVLVPCIFSALTAAELAESVGIHGETFQVLAIPDFSVMTGGKVTVLAAGCGLISILFCFVLHKAKELYQKYFKNPYVRVFAAGCFVVALTFLLGTTDYNGAGMPVIERAIEGEAAPFAFLWKILFTALTIEAGFKGGEIVPSFFIGATFGAFFGQIFGISPSLCAAASMAGVFSGVTNCPVSSVLIALELFGMEGLPYYLIAVSVSYMLSGYCSLYGTQKILYSKYEPYRKMEKQIDEN